MAELRDEKLDLWIHNRWNVLLEGRHGVGKTERIKAAFDRNKINWRYFSGGTLDPWVDFVGIPKAVERNGKEVITLVRPEWHYEPVEALFVDEFNRTHSKVQNACLELLQYKTINGHPISTLKMIWVAINPQLEDEYNVEKLDKATKDRFIIQFEVENVPCPIYFNKKHPDYAKAALAWWRELPEAMKLEISPRRLEDAIKVHKGLGDLADCLPRGCNVTKLVQTFKIGRPVTEKLKELYDNKNLDDARRFLAVENHFAQAKGYILGNDEWQQFFVPLMQPEKVSCLISESDKVCKLVCDNAHKEPAYTNAMHEILRANTNKKLVREIKRHLKGTNILVAQYGDLVNNTEFEEPFFNKGVSNIEWDAMIALWKTQEIETTPQRVALFKHLHSKMPEKLNSQQAVDTLDLIGLIASRSWPEKLLDLPDLMGIVNHCIMAIHRETHVNWLEMLKVYGPTLGGLLGRLEKAGLHTKVMCPITQMPGIGELILERKEMVS
jgi:hypothetical protein